MTGRSGPAAGQHGYFHETAFYGSDDEFVSIVEPFLRDGIEAGEPTLVTCGPANTALLQRAVGANSGVAFVPADDRYRSPAAPAVATPGPSRTLRIRFEEPQRAIAPGQSVVLYAGERLLGGGTISRARS